DTVPSVCSVVRARVPPDVAGGTGGGGGERQGDGPRLPAPAGAPPPAIRTADARPSPGKTRAVGRIGSRPLGGGASHTGPASAGRGGAGPAAGPAASLYRRAPMPTTMKGVHREGRRSDAPRTDRLDGTLADLRAGVGTGARPEARRRGRRRAGGDDRRLRPC